MNFLPSRSAWLHLRFAFSLFLLPVFVFALSQAPHADPLRILLVFISWHFFIYPASNGYNSYFDKDEGSIALLRNPPKVDKGLYILSLTFDVIGIGLALFVNLEFTLAVLIYGLLSKLYSHPAVRLKKYAILSFLVVFIFQGALVYWTSYAAIAGLSIFSIVDTEFILAGLICSCLVGASYPLTQVYQHDEDRERGDRTLSMLLGIRGSFWFAAVLFGLGTVLQFMYWNRLNNLYFFQVFLLFAAPVFALFVYWFVKVWHNEENANFRYMSIMTTLSGIMMLLYFLLVWFSNGIAKA